MATDFNLSINFQRSVVSRMLRDRQFYYEVKPMLSAEFFDSAPLQWICRKMINERASGFEMITVMLKQETLKKKINDDLKLALIDEIKIIYNRDTPEEADYAIKLVKDFIVSQKLSNGMYQASVRLKDGGDANLILDRLRTDIAGDYSEKANTINYVANRRERFTERQDTVDQGLVVQASTGIKAMDEDIGGPFLGQVWSFFGNTNIGKSIFAMSIGRANLLADLKTWHIVIEDPREMTLQRYDTAFTGIKYDTFTNCSFTKEEAERIEKVFVILEGKRAENLYVSKLNDNCSMTDIKEEYQRIRYKYKFHPQVVIIDSPHSMEPSRQRESTRIAYKGIYEEIREFTRKALVATFLLDQSKQEVEGKVAGTDAFSESYDKARIVDGFVTLNQTRPQRKEGTIQLYVAKMKDREKHMSYICRPRFDIMRYDSVGGV